MDLRDWNGWEPRDAGEDQRPFNTDRDDWSHTDWAQVKVLKKNPRLLGNRILQKIFHITAVGSETTDLNYEPTAGTLIKPFPQKC